MKRLIQASMVLFAIMALALPARAQSDSVGTVQLVKVWAYEKRPPKEWDDLLFRENVFMEQWLRTPADGALHVQMADGTELRLGSQAEMVIDLFVYNPDKNDGAFAARLGRGIFRFISGKVAKEGVRIETPTAWIGIRGTDFIVNITNITTVQVISGIVTVLPKAPGASASVVNAGDTVSVGPGQRTASAAQTPTYDYGLSDDGGFEGSGGLDGGGADGDPAGGQGGAESGGGDSDGGGGGGGGGGG